MSIAHGYPYRTQFCFAWCGRTGCECSKPMKPMMISEPTVDKYYENLDQDGKIHYIRKLNEFDVDDLEEMIRITENEPDDLVRALARAKLEGRAISIIKNLIDQIPNYLDSKAAEE